MNVSDAMQMTKNFEGLRLKPYRCSAGKLTIGYGRNLEDVGITDSEADMLFFNDYDRARRNLKALLITNGINPESLHKDVFYALTDMMFNLGYDRLSKFKMLLCELKKGSYEGVIREMKNSKWYTQVGNRSKKLIEIIKNVLTNEKNMI